MANRGVAGLLLRTNKKEKRSSPTTDYICNTYKKEIKASGVNESHVNACKFLVEAARRVAGLRRSGRKTIEEGSMRRIYICYGLC
nr:hypothetical protein CFP56_29112 [Quercus suber]